MHGLPSVEEGGNSRTWYILGTVGKWLVLVGLVRLVSGISFERADFFFWLERGGGGGLCRDKQHKWAECTLGAFEEFEYAMNAANRQCT